MKPLKDELIEFDPDEDDEEDEDDLEAKADGSVLSIRVHDGIMTKDKFGG